MELTRRKVSLAVLLILIVALGVTFFRVVAPFLLPLFLAGMTAVVCQPLFRYFLKRTKDRISLAAALATGTIMASILIPLITGTLIATLQLYTFASRVADDSRWQLIFRNPAVVAADDLALEEAENLDKNGSDAADETPELPPSEPGDSLPEKPEEEKQVSEEKPESETLAIIELVKTPVTETEEQPETAKNSSSADSRSPDGAESALEDAVKYTNSWLPREMQSEPKLVSKELRLRIGSMIQNIGDRSLGRAAGTTFGFLTGALGTLIAALIGLMMYVVALYYFLADGTALILATEKLIPVHAKYQRQLLEQFALVVRSVVVATFLAAFAQGIATTLALWVFGFDHIFVLLVIATISALIPIAGTWLVWVPCVVVLFASGHWIQASLLAIYGSAFVGFLDNVVRTYVLNNDTKLHPLLAFISILGGLQVMGLWGVFIGPIVASCLHALIQIFNHELQELTKEKEGTIFGDQEQAPLPAAATKANTVKNPEK